jgi:hypothetical protein
VKEAVDWALHEDDSVLPSGHTIERLDHDPSALRTGRFVTDQVRFLGHWRSPALLEVSQSVILPYTVVQAPVGSVSVKFAGGRMVEALNALIGDGQFNEWEVAYPGHVVVVVRSHDLSARTVMAPLNVPIPVR